MDVSATPSGAYWVEMRHAERSLGAGFLVTRCHVITAAHCVRGLPEGADLTVIPNGGESVPARLEELPTGADLALVRVLARLEPSVRPPRAGLCRRDDAWFGPYRPSPDDPHLTGCVVHDCVNYRCADGGNLTALQLTTSVELGDYRGYSGGPVESSETGAVVGILLEQYPDRATRGRSSNVLFAAALGAALRRFDAFDVGHLLDVLGGQPATLAQRSAREAIDRAELMLLALRDWAERGLLEPGEARKLRMRVAKEIADG